MNTSDGRAAPDSFDRVVGVIEVLILAVVICGAFALLFAFPVLALGASLGGWALGGLTIAIVLTLTRAFAGRHPDADGLFMALLVMLVLGLATYAALALFTGFFG